MFTPNASKLSFDTKSSLIVTDKEIEKPILDDREYRIIKLPNELEVLLIHDAETDKASAALDVNVGSFSDPVDLNGLAHFCEHLLFLGTEKYPLENEYSSYLSEHGGYSNAYTAREHTNYYFEVNSPHLEGALDRFAQFFISPLFNPSGKDREINAVDSENKKNLQNDAWRLNQLYSSLSNPNHPTFKFSTGNFTTLSAVPVSKGIDVREALINFYQSHYSSNIMKLVILGKESLDQLEFWATEKFSSIKNKAAQLPYYNVPPLRESDLGRVIYAKPVTDNQSIELTFPLPDLTNFYEDQPGNYYSHLIGHEASGSILSYLKRKGWAVNLSAGARHVCKGHDFFFIEVELTDDGVKNWEKIIIVIFQYLKLLSLNPAHEWIFDELKVVSQTIFKFQQKKNASSTTSNLAAKLQKNELPRDWILSDRVVRKFSSEHINSLMSYFTPSNFLIMVISKSVETNAKEKWYGTEYSVKEMTADFINKLRNVSLNSELHLPDRNEFIATNFTVNKIPVETKAKVPTLLEDHEGMRLWHKKDDTFWVPDATVILEFFNPLIRSSPANYVKSLTYFKLLMDDLNEISYLASTAGFYFNIASSSNGFFIELSGFNDKISVLLESLLLKIKSFNPSEDRFDVIKEKLIRDMGNLGLSVPYIQIGYYTRHLLNENSWTFIELSSELEQLSFKDVKNFYPLILSQFNLETLVIGNLTKEESIKMIKLAKNILDYRPLHLSQLIRPRSYVIPCGRSSKYVVYTQDKKNINSCIEYFLQVGQVNCPRTKALLSIVATICKEPAFDQLRTKEQLGYVVFSGIKTMFTTVGYRILIQSERSTEYLEKRIEAFLLKFEKNLETLKEDVYQTYINSIVAKKLEKHKNLGEEQDWLWKRICDGYYDFVQNETEAAIVKTIKKEEVIEFFRKHISVNSKTRAKLVVHLKSHCTPSEGEFARRDIVNLVQSIGLSYHKPHLDDIQEKAANSDCSIDDLVEELVQILIADGDCSPNIVTEKVEDNKEKFAEKFGKIRESANEEDKSKKIYKEDKSDSVCVNDNERKDDDKTIDEPINVSNDTEETITNESNYKSSLTLSCAPLPVRSLSIYKDNEPKL